VNGYRDASKSLRGFLIRGKHPEIDWLVIAQKKNNIVESGSRENEPYEQYLAELAEKYRVPVFTYSRQKVVEEPAFQ